MSDTDFSLRAITLAVLAESDSEDREQIIKEVEHRIARKDLAEALRQALPLFVHNVGTSIRFTAPVPSPAGQGAGTRNSGRSSKVAAIRDAWMKHLESRYTVADGYWRKLGDFCHEDLVYKAAELERQAKDRAERAALLTALAGTLEASGAERVRDLPADVLRGFFAALPEGEAA